MHTKSEQSYKFKHHPGWTGNWTQFLAFCSLSDGIPSKKSWSLSCQDQQLSLLIFPSFIRALWFFPGTGLCPRMRMIKMGHRINSSKGKKVGLEGKDRIEIGLKIIQTKQDTCGKINYDNEKGNGEVNLSCALNTSLLEFYICYSQLR